MTDYIIWYKLKPVIGRSIVNDMRWKSLAKTGDFMSAWRAVGIYRRDPKYDQYMFVAGTTSPEGMEL